MPALPVLTQWFSPPLPARLTAGRRRAIVFVHGIFSDHHTFETAKNHFANDPTTNNIELFYFDYAYKNAMHDNGEALAKKLSNTFRDEDEVVIFAHSMGGLVARFAVLSQPMNFVKLIFLVGTPNSGAMRLSQLTWLLQLIHGATNLVFAAFPRWSGVTSLSNVSAKFDQLRSQAKNVLEIDYVSIPGRRFHEDRSIFDFGTKASGISFSAIDVALARLLNIRLSRPHDGIVEESSNNLSKSPRWTEKIDSYGSPRGNTPATYMHFSVAACNELNHVQIHSDQEVLEMIKMIIISRLGVSGSVKASLEQWIAGLNKLIRVQYGVSASFDK